MEWNDFSMRAARERWKKKGGPRPAQRPDGFPTRQSVDWMTDAELAINNAIAAVERSGASLALTDAVILLGRAKDRVADHVEGVRADESLAAHDGDPDYEMRRRAADAEKRLADATLVRDPDGMNALSEGAAAAIEDAFATGYAGASIAGRWVGAVEMRRKHVAGIIRRALEAVISGDTKDP